MSIDVSGTETAGEICCGQMKQDTENVMVLDAFYTLTKKQENYYLY